MFQTEVIHDKKGFFGFSKGNCSNNPDFNGTSCWFCKNLLSNFENQQKKLDKPFFINPFLITNIMNYEPDEIKSFITDIFSSYTNESLNQYITSLFYKLSTDVVRPKKVIAVFAYHPDDESSSIIIFSFTMIEIPNKIWNRLLGRTPKLRINCQKHILYPMNNNYD